MMRMIRSALLLMAGFAAGVIWLVNVCYKLLKAVEPNTAKIVKDSAVDTIADVIKGEPRRRPYADYSRRRTVFDTPPTSPGFTDEPDDAVAPS